MIELLIEYSANLYDAFIGTWLITKLNGKRLNECNFSYLVIFLLFMVANVFTHHSNYSLFVQCVISIAIHYLYLFSLLKRQPKKVVGMLSPIIFQVVLISSNLLVLFSLNKMLSISIPDLVWSSSYGRFILLVTSKIILTSVSIILTRLLHPTEKSFTLFDLVGYLLFPFITIIHMDLYSRIGMRYNVTDFGIFFVFSIISLVIINILVFVLFHRTIQNTSAKHELELLNNRSEVEEKRYSEIGNIYNQLQIARHDLKAHLVYIDSLIAQKRYDDVERYIADRREELEKTRSVHHTGNRTLDYIISSKLINTKDISFIITGTLGELNSINDLDTASLFGNIIDNAIEGVKDTSNPNITLEFSVTGNYQNILCKNTISKSVLKHNPELKTSKSEPNRHGYGIQSIRRIVKKYNGMIEFYEEDNYFCTHIAIQNKIA